MARTLRSDKGLFLAVLFLVCVSAVMVSSASAAAALQNNWHVLRYLFKQSTWVIAGFLLMAVTMKINYRGYQQPFVVWAGLGIIAVSLLIVLVAAPEINGSKRWFGVGGIGVQPSEFAKLALVLFLADLMARRMDKVNDLTAVVVPVGMVLGCLVGLTLLQPDLGTSAFLVMLAVVMIFAAGLHYRYLLGVAACGLPALAALILLSPRRAERIERIMMWINPWSDAAGGGFQIIQSFIAIGSGGVTGRGFMQGLQKIGFLPESNTDFIYAVIGEEFGLLGTTLVLLAFVDHRLARLPRGDDDARYLRRVPRPRADHAARGAGARQHQRGDRRAAQQGPAAAVRQRRRVVDVRLDAGRRDAAEPVAAHGPAPGRRDAGGGGLGAR